MLYLLLTISAAPNDFFGGFFLPFFFISELLFLAIFDYRSRPVGLRVSEPYGLLAIPHNDLF